MSVELGVLKACAHVMQEADLVTIDGDRLDVLARDILRKGSTPTPWNFDLHFFDGTERTLYYVFVLDALNFCFWSDPGKPRWSVTFCGRVYNGYWALAVSLKKAFMEGIPLWMPERLRDLTGEELACVLRGSVEIPLFSERLENVRELGEILLAKFNGNLSALVEQAGGDALSLVRSIAEHFTSFDDKAHYKDRRVPFYKRAQITVSDLAATFSHRGWGRFDNLAGLTAFADYKIPQVLRSRGVLVYGAELARIVDDRKFLAAGSPAEVEIRAATVWGVEMLCRHLADQGCSVTAAELDGLLWQIGQETGPGDLPYHLTRTIYY
jgi:hypothetical protein